MNPSEGEMQSLSHRHAHLSRKQAWAVWLRAWGLVLPLVALILLLVSALGALSVLRLSSIPASAPADVAHAPEQTGSAVVVAMGSYDVKSGLPPTMMSFRIQGRLVTQNITNVEQWAQTRVGDTVAVKYRVNQNGEIYIDSWQPPASKMHLPLHP